MSPSTSISLSDEVLEQLQLLIQANLAYRDGCRQAIEISESKDVTAMLERLAATHNQQANVLRNISWSSFKTAERSGALNAADERHWTGPEIRFQNSAQAVLDQIILMQKHVGDLYRAALKTIGGRAIRQVLNEHLLKAESDESALQSERAKHG